jgi:hypothetical protein
MKELYQKHCLLIMAAVTYHTIHTCWGEAYIQTLQCMVPHSTLPHTLPFCNRRLRLLGLEFRTNNVKFNAGSIREFQTDDRTHHHAHASDHSLTPVQLKEGHSKQS